MIAFRRTTKIAQTIQARATADNLQVIAGRLLRLPLDQAAKALSARWLTLRGIKGIHVRAASMILARMYRLDPKKTLVVAQNIITQRGVTVLGEQLLDETGWVDLGVEVLALGCHKVASVEVRTDVLSGSYKVLDLNSRRLHVIASAEKVNQGHLIDLKFSPGHFTK